LENVTTLSTWTDIQKRELPWWRS